MIAIFLVFFGCSTPPLRLSSNDFVEFESELHEDSEFIHSNKFWLTTEFQKMNDYFELERSGKVKIQILPYFRNSEFKNCARVYGTSRIYAHSPKSLEVGDLRSGINSYCLGQGYSGLKFTLVHEFIHTRTLLLTGDVQLPPWLWEGAAVALSGEVHLTRRRNEIFNELKAITSLNVCSNEEMNKKPYHYGGSVLYFLEAKQPGFVKKLILLFSKAEKEAKKLHLGSFLSENELTCQISSGDLISSLSSKKVQDE